MFFVTVIRRLMSGWVIRLNELILKPKVRIFDDSVTIRVEHNKVIFSVELDNCGNDFIVSLSVLKKFLRNAGCVQK